MSEIVCFFLSPLPWAQRSHRRFVYATEERGKCPLAHGYHDARVFLGDEQLPLGASERGEMVTQEDALATEAPWPVACACGYVFRAEDERQVNVERLYSRSDGGAATSIHEAAHGAMWDAPWYREGDPTHVGPDGITLVVRTPGGDWLPDAPNHRWTRTGSVPRVTCTPSILFYEGPGLKTPGYHAFLTDGVLRSC